MADIKKIKIDNTEYNVKDKQARDAVEGAIDEITAKKADALESIASTAASEEREAIEAIAAEGTSVLSSIPSDYSDLSAAVGPDEASSTASAPHPAGSYFIYDGGLYEATLNIAAGGTIVTSGTGQNCRAVPGGIAEEVVDLKSAIEFINGGPVIMQSENLANPSDFNVGYKYGGYGVSLNAPVSDSNYCCFVLTGIATGDTLVLNTNSVEIRYYNKNKVITGSYQQFITLTNDVYTFVVEIQNIDQGAGVAINVKKSVLDKLEFLYIAKKTDYDQNGKRFRPATGHSVSFPVINRYVHFSIDDVTLWADFITNENTYSSIFDNQKLAMLKKMHDEYGLCVTLNTFNVDSSDHSISNVPTKFAAEFKANSNWLKFAFHASDADKRYNEDDATTAAQYSTFTSGIYQLTGTANAIDRFTRLGFFTGTLNNVIAMRDSTMGVCGLSSPDDDSNFGYYLNATIRDIINSKGRYYDKDHNIQFIKSQTRLESLSLDNTLPTYDTLAKGEMARYLEFFTHESLLINVYNTLILLCNWLVKNGYQMCFMSDKFMDAMDDFMM